MDNEVYSFALKSALTELQNACPEITNAFIFKEDGEILAGDEKTSEKIMVHVVNALDGVFEKADIVGGVKDITLEGSNGRVNVSNINDIYFVTVTSKKADLTYVNAVTRVLVPTVLKLLEKISPALLESNSSLPEIKPKFPLANKDEEIENNSFEEPAHKEEKTMTENNSEPLRPEPAVNQLIVENLGGLLVPSDTVRIDNEILLQWEKLYEGKRIEEVEIETFDGKATRCKVKPVKDSKFEGKGVIQMPEKVQLILEIKKGELVRAKPIIE